MDRSERAQRFWNSAITVTKQSRTTHQKYRLFQSKLLNASFDNTCAECDDTSLQKKKFQRGSMRILPLLTISMAPQKDI